MSRSRWLVAAVALGLVVGVPQTAHAAPPADLNKKVDARLLAEFGHTDEATFFVDLADAGALPTTAGSKAARATRVYEEKVAHAEETQRPVRELLDARHVDYTPFWISNTIRVSGDIALVRELAARGDVGRLSLPAVAATGDPVAVTGATGSVELPYGLTQIGADKVWDDFGVRGDGVVVGSLDTGVQWDHPALARQYRGAGGEHAYNWFDGFGECAGPCDDVGHGTHTTGTMVGDDGAGHVVGVAPGAQWIAARACREGFGCPEEALLAAGQWMLAPTDADGRNPRPDLAPDIVNNSWGGDEDGSRFYDDIIDAWVSAGIFPVFSNGNNGEYGCDTAGYPGTNAKAYAVGAVDSTGAAAYFSSRGAAADGSTRPDIAAPGVNTLSSVPGGGYELNSGTSMAAPHVSGAVALLWSAQPNLRRDVEATRALLDSTAHDADDTSCGGTAADNNVYGEGRLDAYALVEAATGGQHGGVTVDVTGAGSPMPDAVVKLTSDVVTRTARTGADGRAELGRVPAGTYTLAVSRFAQLTQRRTLTLAAGDAPQLTVDLTAPAPWHQVHGTITGPGGKPLAGVTVKLADETFPGFTTKADGTFSGPLPEGDYDVIIDYGRWLAPKTVPLTVDGDETLDVTLEAKADRYGYTVAETTAKFTTGGNVFKLTGDDAAADASLPFPVTIYGRTYRKVTVHTDGYLSFAGEATINGFRDDLVLDKKSQVHTRTTGSGTTRTFGVTWQGALIKGTSTRIDVQILLGEGGALTVVWHNVGTGTAATVGIVDDKGGDSLTYGTVPGDKVAVTFAVPGAGLVRGTVTDANDGKPVASASVTAGPVTTVTDADGVWQVQVPAGDAVVAATKASYESGSATVAVRAGAVTVVRTSLRTSLLTAPAKVSATVKAGGTATIQVPLRNKGTVAATYDAREVNSAQKPAGVPGKVLGSFGVGDFYNAYGVDWHDGKLLVTDTYFWGQVERFDESGKVLTKGVVGMNGWASDFTPIGDDLTCAPSMSIVGDLPIVCINRDTLTVEQEIPTPKPGTLYYGLAYRAADDTFYLAGDGGIRHIAGPRHPQPGAVLGMCVPARPWTTGLELNEKANVLWSINQDNAGEALRALDPDTCAELSWVPDPDTDPLSGAGITLDDSGDLWTVGQAIGQPGGARVHHVAGDLPAYSEIPWLTVAAPAGSVPVGGAASLPVTLDTSGLARGTYTAHVLLVSNGATTPSVPVAVTVTVS